MPADLAEAHKHVGDEVHFLYTKWNYFKFLFCLSDETVATLYYAAEFFFEIYREVLRDDIFLSLCRLTDPATTKVKGQDKSNLTLKHLAGMIHDSEASLRHAVALDLKEIDSKSKSFRQHRNCRIGHFDLDTQLRKENALLPNIGIDETDNLLASISTLLNRIHKFYGQGEHTYEAGVYGRGDAQTLVNFINHERRLKQYFNEKEFSR